MDWWLCYPCGKGFVHARLWARHLREIHGRHVCALRG